MMQLSTTRRQAKRVQYVHAFPTLMGFKITFAPRSATLMRLYRPAETIAPRAKKGNMPRCAVPCTFPSLPFRARLLFTRRSSRTCLQRQGRPRTAWSSNENRVTVPPILWALVQAWFWQYHKKFEYGLNSG